MEIGLTVCIIHLLVFTRTLNHADGVTLDEETTVAYLYASSI